MMEPTRPDLSRRLCGVLRHRACAHGLRRARHGAAGVRRLDTAAGGRGAQHARIAAASASSTMGAVPAIACGALRPLGSSARISRILGAANDWRGPPRDTPGNLQQWITDTEQIKPGARMPAFTRSRRRTSLRCCRVPEPRMSESMAPPDAELTRLCGQETRFAAVWETPKAFATGRRSTIQHRRRSGTRQRPAPSCCSAARSGADARATGGSGDSS